MIFVYPKDLLSKDRLRIVDAETNKAFFEDVVSISVPEKPGASVLVFTDKRTVVCDPGSKVAIERMVEHSVGE